MSKLTCKYLHVQGTVGTKLPRLITNVKYEMRSSQRSRAYGLCLLVSEFMETWKFSHSNESPHEVGLFSLNSFTISNKGFISCKVQTLFMYSYETSR